MGATAVGVVTPRVLIIVENLPVPLDRRVWLECRALIARGYQVSVICPKGPGDPRRQTIDGVAIYKYRPAPEASGLLGFVVEFLYCWIRTALLSLTVHRERGFDIIQACNPPDTYWLLGLLWKSRGVKYVFDHHDLNPELFLSRFGEPTSARETAEYRGLLGLERMTFRVADKVISTNESYRRVAIERGHRDPCDVTVVRSGPDTTKMRPVRPATDPGRGRSMLVYLGIMGPQDRVDVVLKVMAELVHRRGRTDVCAALLGFGDCFEELKAEAHRLGLDDHVEFTGRVGPDVIAEYLSAASIGLCPDCKSPLNDVSTMNKTMEYMAYAVPSVSFDLVETRVSAGETALYATCDDIQAFADAVERLLDDEDLRTTMSLAARERVVRELDWRPQAERYIGVYDRLTGRPSDPEQLGWPVRDLRTIEGMFTDHDAQGREYVDLRIPGELERFVRARGARPVAAPRRPQVELQLPQVELQLPQVELESQHQLQ